MNLLLYVLIFIFILPIILAIGAIVSIVYFCLLKPIREYKKLTPEERKEMYPPGYGIFGENWMCLL